MAGEGDCPVCFEEQNEPFVTPCVCGFELCFWCVSLPGRQSPARREGENSKVAR